MTIRVVSGFEKRFVGNTKLQKTCSNCFEKALLAQMSNGDLCCKPCSEDIEALTNRLPPTEERRT